MDWNLVSITFNSPQLGKQLKRNILNFRTLIQRYAQFRVLEKSLGIVSLPHFVYGFSRTMFLMLHSANWPDFIAWLPLLLEILVNMCIAIVCKPGCVVTDFEINLIFLIKPFSYITKKSRQKFKYLENKKSF